MAIYSKNNFRAGLKIILENEPYLIEFSEFVNPGKGKAFVRTKLRRLLIGTCIEKTFKSTESAEIADILDINLNYLYNDGKVWYFINDKTFEQITVDKRVIGNSAKWLLHQEKCIVTLWNDQPIMIIPPRFVELKIIDTDPRLKGNTVLSGNKPAILSTGTLIKVPFFVKVGEVIKVDTRFGTYVSRVR